MTEPDDQPPQADHQQAQPADPRVSDAVRRLDELSELPTGDHVEVYESVHRSLQESLADAAEQSEAPGDAQVDGPAGGASS